MVLCTSSGERRTKKDFVDAGRGGNRSIDEIYTPGFRARAGSTKDIFFFIRLIGF
jgi:hypothetical protein